MGLCTTSVEFLSLLVDRIDSEYVVEDDVRRR